MCFIEMQFNDALATMQEAENNRAQAIDDLIQSGSARKTMESKKWGLVGGGIMGMTLGTSNLPGRVISVTIFEAAPELGRAGKLLENGRYVEWDKFYHVILLLSDFRTRKILKEIGVEDEIPSGWKPRQVFTLNGRLYSMSDTMSNS